MSDDIKIRITADASDVKKETAEVKRELATMGDTGVVAAEGIKTSMLGVGLALAPVIAALTALVALGAFMKVADEAMEAENKVARLAGRTKDVQPTITGAFHEIKNAVVMFSLSVEKGTGFVGAIGRVMSEVAQVIAIFARNLASGANESNKLASNKGAIEFAQSVGRAFAYMGDVIAATWRVVYDSVTGIISLVKAGAAQIGGFAAALLQLAQGHFTQAASIMRETMADAGRSIYTMTTGAIANFNQLTAAITGNGAAMEAYRAQLASGTRTDLSDPLKPKKDKGGGDGGDDQDLQRIVIYSHKMKELEEQLSRISIYNHKMKGGKDGKEEQGPIAAILGAGLDGVSKSFGTALDSILTRSKTFGQAMIGVWGSMRAAIINEIGKIMLAKVAAFAKDKLLALAHISAEGAKAGAGAASSQASIPYVGPILAIAAMAAVLGSVLGLSSGIKSAAGGFDIPAGLNPVTQLHAEEMVLPSEHANTIREMSRGGGSAPINLQGVSAGDFFIAVRKDLVKALQGARRDMVF